MTTQIEIKEIKQKNLIYVPAIGTQNNKSSFEKLTKWTSENKILSSFDPTKTEFITIYSDFENTAMKESLIDLDKINLMACIKIDTVLTEDYSIKSTEIKAGKCAVGKFEISSTSEDFSESWKKLVLWTIENGCEKDNRAPFEIYRSFANELNQMKVELYYPIQ